MAARVEGGLDFTLPGGVSLSVKGEVGGLGRSRYETISGGGRLSVSF